MELQGILNQIFSGINTARKLRIGRRRPADVAFHLRIVMRSLYRRLSKLEALALLARRPKKRCMPDWLQSEYEQRGWVFDAAGQIASGPRYDIEADMTDKRPQ